MKKGFLNQAKRWACFMLCLLLVLSVLAGCGDSGNGDGSKGDGDKPSETVVIKFGTHALYDDDPTYVDPVTGKSTMEPEDQAAYMAGMQAVLDTYNVKIEWVEYSENAATDVLRSLLAEDPICDVALCVTDTQGILLGQNVFQELDEYAYIFDNDDYSWMWADPIMGHNYVLNCDIRLTTSPLVFNISMLDKVDALKDSSGKTVYPTDLYKKGEWTWSTFRDYLSKIDAYYANKTSSVTGSKIHAYHSTLHVAVRQAIHSNGGAIYSSANGLEVGSKADLGAMEYLQGLMDSGLMYGKTISKTNLFSSQPDAADAFADGEAVFGNLYTWGTGWVGGELADRGESMGLVPFPVADDADKNSDAYDQISFISDTCSVVRGLSKERTELALKAYALYYTTYYKTLGGVDSMADYRSTTAEQAALSDGYDVYHERIGQDIIDIYASMYGAPANDLSTVVSIHNDFVQIANASLTGQAKGYAVNIQEKLPTLKGTLDTLQSALSSGKLVDVVPPEVLAQAIPVPVGSSIDDVKGLLSKYVSVKDKMDGDIDASLSSIDVNDVNFNKVGDYIGSLTAYDKSLNGKTVDLHIYVYNANNTKAPTLKVKSVYRLIKMDEDVSTINWADFVDTAKDADGLDLSTRVKADVTTLNTSVEGDYDVVLTVTDFAGNTASATITLSVLDI